MTAGELAAAIAFSALAIIAVSLLRRRRMRLQRPDKATELRPGSEQDSSSTASAQAIPTLAIRSTQPESAFDPDEEALPDSSTPMVPPHDAPNIGMYEVLGIIQEGGMGIVFKARHTTLRRVVALKMMRSDALGRPKLAERFRREMEVAARLDHPNIVRIYEVGEHNNQPYYTMAFLNGGTLAKHRSRLLAEPTATLALMERVSRAVHFAHEHGILHRDLKPSNILLDDHGEPLITDFGLAKFREGDVELTQSGSVLGTPAYMSPEQASGRIREIGVGTDVWALGVMLFELLTGSRPFVDETVEDVKRRIIHEEPPRPRALRPELTVDLEHVVLRCLEKEPSRRYRSAGELAEDLGRCLRGERLWRRPPVWLRRIGEVLLRSPKITLAAAVGVVAVGAFALTLFQSDPKDTRTPPNLEREAIVLIGETGPPRKGMDWIVGTHAAEVDKNAECFTFSTADKSALMLLPRVPWQTFRFEAEIWQKDTENGTAGLFLGAPEQVPNKAAAGSCLLFEFGQMGFHRGRLSAEFWRIDDPGGRVRMSAMFPWSHHFPSRQGWQRLAVNVFADELDLFIDGEILRTLSRIEIDKAGADVFIPRGNQPGSFSPVDGLGIHIEQKGTASFRNVVITRIP